MHCSPQDLKTWDVEDMGAEYEQNMNFALIDMKTHIDWTCVWILETIKNWIISRMESGLTVSEAMQHLEWHQVLSLVVIHTSKHRHKYYKYYKQTAISLK